MTFSVDPDFWLFQSGPRQDGLTRTEASEGRGKAFASSLFGVSEGSEAPDIGTLTEGETLMLASLNLAQASVSPAFGGDGLEQVATPFETPLPETDLTQGPGLTVAPEVADIKTAHPAEAQPVSGGILPTLSQNALPDNSPDSNAPAGALSVADTDLPEDAPPAEATAAAPPPLALPAAEPTPIATMGEASTEAPDVKTASLPERKPLAPESTGTADTNPYDTAALSQDTLVTPVAAPLPAPEEIPSPPDIELAAAPPSAQPQPRPLASDIATPAEASPRAAEVPVEAMVAPPVVTRATVVSPPPIRPTVPAAAAPAADTRQNRSVSTEVEMQPAPLDGTFVDMIETVAGSTSVSDTPIKPQAGTGDDILSGPLIAPLSASGSFVQGQPASQIAILPASTPLAPTHAVLIAAPSQLHDIVARATRDGGQDDRITVQLDPPELGRISIDFKFDGQGLQHVTITAESPEAMRQLRQMHFELVQALERNGLSGQDMSFQHQNPQQNEGWGQRVKLGGARPEDPTLTGSGLIIAADNTPNRQNASSGRLDIRL